jgi:hypothetical protein
MFCYTRRWATWPEYGLSHIILAKFALWPLLVLMRHKLASVSHWRIKFKQIFVIHLPTDLWSSLHLDKKHFLKKDSAHACSSHVGLQVLSIQGHRFWYSSNVADVHRGRHRVASLQVLDTGTQIMIYLQHGGRHRRTSVEDVIAWHHCKSSILGHRFWYTSNMADVRREHYRVPCRHSKSSMQGHIIWYTSNMRTSRTSSRGFTASPLYRDTDSDMPPKWRTSWRGFTASTLCRDTDSDIPPIWWTSVEDVIAWRHCKSSIQGQLLIYLQHGGRDGRHHVASLQVLDTGILWYERNIRNCWFGGLILFSYESLAACLKRCGEHVRNATSSLLKPVQQDTCQ